MKICITARGATLESAFERHFARAPYFILYTTGTGFSEAIRNGFVISNAKIGQNTVRLLKMSGIEAVITREIGENARNLLKGADISIHIFNGEGTVKDAVAAIALD
ncbi:MAG: dinitrogenase iron-molybdenum cofactor biosynthesis protein [Methanoregula sp.]|nr:dinitrogenase iron-molybdenum cofactor biosynthesis protein [Methanoregula sp.]